ncbi:MAG: hypothetical protein BroJett026_35700 [Betaproteobacteria bacterium]|nr:MAG: hypothetical protein BroJett026_35700 [Betaproteobacteria bacterium]
MKVAPLNLFQCAMLRWRELHPYCAAHVIAVPVELDAGQLRAVIGGVLDDRGLTGFELDAARRRFVLHGGRAQPSLTVLDGETPALDRAAAFIASSINRPFPAAGRFDPFRFFAVADGRCCLVGVVYDHLVAGGDSIAVLMTDIAARAAARDPRDVPLAPLALPSRTCRHLFARHPWVLLRALLALPGLVRGWRTAVRPRLADPADGRNGFLHFGIGAAAYAALRARAKALGVTTNDVLLASVLAAAAPLAPHRDPARRRHAIAVASIVNLRADFQPPAHEVFGQFLSSFRVVHPLPDGMTLDDLARAVGAQTARARHARLHYLTLLAMALAGGLWRHASTSRRQRIYLKYHPVVAGITPLAVDPLRRHGPGTPGDYLRAASTGPMSPLVVALTTSAGALRVGITYRTTAIDDQQARAFALRLARSLDPAPATTQAHPATVP